MSDRARPRSLLGACVALAARWRARVDLPRPRCAQFWGDGATYHAMAWSLAEDGDLRYEARDVFRVRREFPAGPQGIFLKRASGGLTLDARAGFPWLRRVRRRRARALYFAKAFALPAWPPRRSCGCSGRAACCSRTRCCLGLALWLAFGELRRRGARPARARSRPRSACSWRTVAPLYLLWPAPEVFNLALIAAGLAAWRRGRPLLSRGPLRHRDLLEAATTCWLALPLGRRAAARLPARAAASAAALLRVARGAALVLGRDRRALLRR